MTPAATIKEVIAKLDEIIAWSKRTSNRMGYFASMYRRTTVAVESYIIQNKFEDAARMEKLDVVFANRYLQAWSDYTNNRPCTSAWCKTFDACKNTKLIVLQHLILGMNAHINLDLAIAAAETCPGNSIYALEKDFNLINDVIASISQHVQNNLAKVWWPLKLLEKLANNREEPVLNFSIRAARRTSWANAVAMALVSGQANTNYIDGVDRQVTAIAQRVINPGFFTSFIVKPVRYMESKNVSNIIDMLES